MDNHLMIPMSYVYVKLWTDITCNLIINFQDEWEYLRLLELVRKVVPELLIVLLNRGLVSNNTEIQEIAKDFL